jgi:hypothetical protein
MTGYLIAGIIGLVIGFYMGNKEFRDKVNTKVKGMIDTAKKNNQKQPVKPVKKTRSITKKMVLK